MTTPPTPIRPTVAETFHLATVSMQRDDPPRQIDEDLDVAFNPGSWGDYGLPDLIGFTEATPGQAVRPRLIRHAERAGYVLNLPESGDVVTAVRAWDPAGAVAVIHELVEVGSVEVLPARSGFDKGNYAAKRVVETTIRTPAGNVITHHGMHWLTAYRLDTTPGPENRREALHLDQSEEIVERVQLHGKGRRISLWSGDLNVDEAADTGFDDSAPHAVFAAAGLRSAFDEVGRYPDTHGRRTIDVAGTYDPDHRVTVKDARSYRRGNSDHRRTSVLLEIAPVPTRARHR